MQQKIKTVIYFSIIGLLFAVIQFNFTGCGGSATKKSLTSEQKKALQDSLFKKHKGIIDLNASLGNELYKQENYKDAKGYFKKVAKIDTTGIYGKIIYQNLGTCYLHLNQPDSAAWAYKMGIKNLPDGPHCYKALGYIYRGQQKNKEAIQIYQKLTQLEPDSANNYHFLGELYASSFKTDKAIEAYQNAVTLESDNNEYMEILTNLLSKTGDSQKIIKQREKMVENNPDNITYRFNLAESYYKAEEYKNAIIHFKVVIENNPKNIQALEYLADSYNNIKKYNNAVKVYKTILTIKTDDKKNICKLASCYTSLGQYTIARRTVTRALKIDNEYGLAYLTLGKIYETAADNRVKNNDSKRKYDDQIVYQLAYNEYLKAKKDLMFKREAVNRLNYLKPIIPTKEDKFINNNRMTPKLDAYNWI